ncbi:MAG: transglutaminase domain-containing protein [Sedimentisphaerales bacterium]|nr:transglutaminase domain-containing protein [Sedimentisphaerales bacterium]
MRVKFLITILLALILTAFGCSKKSKPEVNRPGPDAQSVKTDNQKPAPDSEEIKTEPNRIEQAADLDGEEAEYLAVFMEGKKVGYAVQNRTEADGKVTTSEDVSITMNRAGVAITVKMTETSIETTDGKPLGFETIQLLGQMEMKVTGVVEPNGLVRMTQGGMGVEQKTTMMWPQGAVMAEGLRLLTEEKGLKEGAEYAAKVFSAGVMQAMDAKIHIGGKKDVNLLGRIVNLTEVATTMTMPMAGEIVTTSFVDDELRALKSLVPVAGMQIEMIACTKEFALGANDVFEVINKMFLASPQPLDNADKASAITYILSPIDDADFEIPTTDNQTVEKLGDGGIRLIVKPASMPVGGTFPYNGDDETILEAMQPNRFLQSDDEELIKLARKAVGDTKDSGQAVRRIESFVADYIEEKDLSVGYASAVEVVRSRQGDCSEHAVLTAAMCRAVGIPARIVTGIAYVDDWRGMQGFGGHAWVQAFIGRKTGKWVGFDAAFKGTGRGGYGPGHIALAVGGGEPADFFNLATTLGKFKIEKAEMEK